MQRCQVQATKFSETSKEAPNSGKTEHFILLENILFLLSFATLSYDLSITIDN